MQACTQNSESTEISVTAIHQIRKIETSREEAACQLPTTAYATGRDTKTGDSRRPRTRPVRGPGLSGAQRRRQDDAMQWVMDPRKCENGQFAGQKTQ